MGILAEANEYTDPLEPTDRLPGDIKTPTEPVASDAVPDTSTPIASPGITAPTSTTEDISVSTGIVVTDPLEPTTPYPGGVDPNATTTTIPDTGITYSENTDASTSTWQPGDPISEHPDFDPFAVNFGLPDGVLNEPPPSQPMPSGGGADEFESWHDWPVSRNTYPNWPGGFYSSGKPRPYKAPNGMIIDPRWPGEYSRVIDGPRKPIPNKHKDNWLDKDWWDTDSGKQSNPYDNSNTNTGLGSIPAGTGNVDGSVDSPTIQNNSMGLDGLYPVPFDVMQTLPPEIQDAIVAQYGPFPGSGGVEGTAYVGGPDNVPRTSLNYTGGVGDENMPEGYEAYVQGVDPDALASARMAEITGKDSVMGQRARQEGMLSAASRGLQNSSIAAGSALGAWVDRAQPIALADAEYMAQQSLANQGAINTARQFSAGLEGDIAKLNAQIRSTEAQTRAGIESTENMTEAQIRARKEEVEAGLRSDERKLDAQIRSQEEMFERAQADQMEQFNANWANQIETLRAEMEQQDRQFNASQQNAINTRVMELNTALNEQYLRGTQAMDLATIQGQFQQLIAQNQVASDLFTSGMSSISQAMANHELTPDRIASYVQIQQNMIHSGLEMINSLNNIDFETDSMSTTNTTSPFNYVGSGGGGTLPGTGYNEQP